ncbi:MAG: hypothetical protein HYV13_01805 [Candidatus Doudnabacteria bacterium]|nr:hypothetical protein [Candidatus Doudnabacteria bacterium]
MHYEKLTIASSLKQALPHKKLDLSEKQIKRLKTVSRIILALAAVAGTVTLAALAPNAVQLLGKLSGQGRFIKSREQKKKYGRQVLKSIYYLKNRGDIELSPAGKDFVLKVTQRGRKKVRRFNFETIEVSKPEFWNHKWWLVLADIPSVPYRKHADFFRDKLKSLGFYPLQRTVWVFPFDPRDQVDFVAAFYSLEKFVTTMEISKLDPDDEKVIFGHFQNKGIL